MTYTVKDFLENNISIGIKVVVVDGKKRYRATKTENGMSKDIPEEVLDKELVGISEFYDNDGNANYIRITCR